MHFLCLKNTLLKDEESAWDNHVLACNFDKYSPTLKQLFTDRLSNKHFLIWLLTTQPHLIYAATLPCNLSLIACKSVNMTLALKMNKLTYAGVWRDVTTVPWLHRDRLPHHVFADVTVTSRWRQIRCRRTEVPFTAHKLNWTEPTCNKSSQLRDAFIGHVRPLSRIFFIIRLAEQVFRLIFGLAEFLRKLQNSAENTAEQYKFGWQTGHSKLSITTHKYKVFDMVLIFYMKTGECLTLNKFKIVMNKYYSMQFLSR